MADMQNDLLDNDNAEINGDNAWEPWPEENQADNELQLNEMQLNEDEQQKESISFDQSGSSSHYLRAHGHDITLTVEDVLAGRFVDSSSSSSEASSNYAITQVQ